MEQNQSEPLEQVQQIRWKAMDLLARREHARGELLKKLLLRYPQQGELLDCVLDALAAEGLQSDHRFVEAYVHARRRKGFGPVKIRLELQDRGVDRDLINSELSRSEHDWYASAAEVWRKKFLRETSCAADADETDENYFPDLLGTKDTDTDKRKTRNTRDTREKSRQFRFLLYRGFSSEHIQPILA